MGVRLFVCPIITLEPLGQFASNFDLITREIHGNVLSLVLRFQVEWVDLNSENLVSQKNPLSAGKRVITWAFMRYLARFSQNFKSFEFLKDSGLNILNFNL